MSAPTRAATAGLLAAALVLAPALAGCDDTVKPAGGSDAVADAPPPEGKRKLRLKKDAVPNSVQDQSKVKNRKLR